MGKIDRDAICLLLKESGDKVYQWKRFKMGIYALSENSLDLKKKSSQIFSYKFDEGCYEGMSDKKLLKDIIALGFNDLIKIERVQRPGFKTEHNLYTLLEHGKILARRAEQNLSSEQISNLEQVAEDLKNEKLMAEDLLVDYAPKWSAKYTQIIKEEHAQF